MYIRQNRIKHRLGTFEGELGQMPIQTITVTDPVDGAQLTFTGPVHEIAQCQALVGLVSGAVGAAKSKNFSQARSALASAKNLIAAVGSQRDKASFLVNKAESFINTKENESKGTSAGTSAGEVLTGMASILAALAPAASTAIQTQADAKAAKLALKASQSAGPQVMYVPTAAAPASNTGLIVGIIGAVVVVGALVVVMSKKK